MSSILVYAPFNQHARDVESLIVAFHRQGHRVLFLSQLEGHPMNDFLRERGVAAYSHVVTGERTGWWYYLRHLFFFIFFCWKHRIEIVYSHLEPCNLVASVGQYFILARTFLCRHHMDEGKLLKFDRNLHYRMTYRLAKKIIVVSEQTRRYMIEKEHIRGAKIIHINLAYDFDLYSRPDESRVQSIRSEYHADILLLAAGRFTTAKRPEAVVHLVAKLKSLGLDVKLILLGQGDLFEEIKLLIAEKGLQMNVFMPGYVGNMLEFMKASDFFIHPSVSESSSVVIKEAGLAKLPAIVCQGVGDFNDYIVNGENGFLVEPDFFVEEAAGIIRQNFMNRAILLEMGANLKKSILNRFSIESVIGQYDELNKRS